MEKSYGAIEDLSSLPEDGFLGEDSGETVKIEVSEETPNAPTMGPIGHRLKRNAQIHYNRE